MLKLRTCAHPKTAFKKINKYEKISATHITIDFYPE